MSSSGGHISMLDALTRIETKPIKERGGGLNDLRYILQHNRENSELGKFDDKSFHKVFETLFIAASDERSTYLKLNSSNPPAAKKTMTACINRFANISLTLRVAVERGAKNIRQRTLKALLDHLTETLMDADGNCCEPIATDYARCLSAVLSYEPHVEHLKDALWRRVTRFCLDRVTSAIPSNSAKAFPAARSMSAAARSIPSLQSLSGDSPASHIDHTLPKGAVDDFILCLRHLTSPPSAPVITDSAAILSTMLRYLEASQSVSQGRVNALTAVNNILVQVRSQKTQLTISFTQPCLQTARNLWSSKQILVKNKILVMLVLLHPYIQHIVLTREDPGFSADLDAMVETMKNEYARRDAKDQLRMDDLRLAPHAENICENLWLPIFSLQDGTASTPNVPDGEHNWTLLYLLTYFSTCKPHNEIVGSGSPEPSHSVAKKRVKLSHWSDELLHSLHDQHVPTRVSALQMISFVTQTTLLNRSVLERLLERLFTLSTDENGLTASWALISLASCAVQSGTEAGGLSRFWKSVWHLAERLVNTSSTCRAACHLMHILVLCDRIDRRTLLETCDMMINSIEVNGPSAISDTVTSFLATVIRRMQQENVRSTKDGGERVLTWLFRTWAPSNFRDRTHALQYASIQPQDIISLASACLSKPKLRPFPQVLPIWGPVAQSWILHKENKDLLEYVLLLEKSIPTFLIDLSQIDSSKSESTATASVTPNESLTLGLLTAELNRVIEQLDHTKDHRGNNINRDMVRILGSLVMVSSCLGTCHNVGDHHRAAQLRAANKTLMDLLFRELSRTNCEQSNVDAFLDVYAHSIVLPSPQVVDHGPVAEHRCMSELAGRVTTLLQTRSLLNQDAFAQDDGSDDAMDIEPNLDSQVSRPDGVTTETYYPRKLVQSAYHPTTRKVSITGYATLMQHVQSSEDDTTLDEQALGELTTFLVRLSYSELLASRPIIAAVYDRVGHFSPKDTSKLINRIIDGPLRSYDHERSETTHALVLEVMLGEIAKWTDPGNPDLYRDASELYDWLTQVALSAEILSSSTQKRLCVVLLQLLQIDPDYGHDEKLPSIRTIMFGMLQMSNLEVGHYLAERLSSIFNLYTLSKHDEVFDDLNSSLPTDIEWTEGIAIRLLALAHLGSRWPSLLRRCMYGIFDTAGQIASSTAYAVRCVSVTSQSLSLESSQELFKLFAPQLLFTWLDFDRHIKDVPFSIFGYDSLVELVEHNMAEVYAQLVIRDDFDSIKWVTDSLRTTEERILRATFPKVVAYAMSWDIVTPDKERQNVCESHLRHLMKSSIEYKSLAVANFPYIIANIYISLDQDGLVDKALEKKPAYSYVSNALKRMKSYSASDQILPATQQPHFKARYLPDQMERAARRASSSQEVVTIEKDLTPSVLTVVLRSIFDAIHPALGPLHTCQVVRKLRLLIAFAGSNAAQGYPLESLLRTLRPLVIDSHCADDVLGILHYLFERGLLYLKANMSVLTSTALLLLLSMKSFMISRQDRTTQESQFRSTVSKMHKFHDWLIQYLLNCQDAFNGDIDPQKKTNFCKLVQSCRDLSLPASADKRNPASMLLQAIMDDEQSKSPLLVRTDRKHVVSLLCSRFEIPESATQDILGSDADSVEYAKCVWSITRSLSQADEYEAWAAKVLGRAFAASVAPELVRPAGRLQPDFIDSSAGELHSTQAIVAKLSSLLLSDDRSAVRVAEGTLRKIVARFNDAKDHNGAIEFESMLLPQIVEAMCEAHSIEGETHGLGRSSLLSKSIKDELYRASRVTSDTTDKPWVRSLALNICKWVSGDPVVGSLCELLGVVEESAQQLFPFILHLALQAEQEKDQVVRAIVSESFKSHFEQSDPTIEGRTRLMLETLLYLLTQPIPQERTRMDRLQWLDVDYHIAAKAASLCNMPAAALYLIELTTTPSPIQETGARSRRSSVDHSFLEAPSDELLLDIYKSVDDPDSFYGVQQAPSLQSVMDRVDHERDGLKGIMLHSAQMDASLRRVGQTQKSDSQGIVRSVGAMNLNGLMHDILSQGKGTERDAATTATMLDSARKLQQWDIVPPTHSPSNTATLYTVCRSMSAATSLDTFKLDLNEAMRVIHRKLQDAQLDALSIKSALSALAVLTEIDELTAVRSVSDLDRIWELMQSREQRWDIGRSDDAQHIISYRETFLGILSRNVHLRESLHISARDSRAIEVKAVVKQSEFARKNDLIQQSLAAATYLTALVPSCAGIGVKIDAVAEFEAASILWKQGETSSSVQMLKRLQKRNDLSEQVVQVGSAGLLAQLGHEIAVARLEKPEEIIGRYLKPAIAQLGATKQGSEAGRVFFEFASFCDQQLQNAGNIEDFKRLERLSQRRSAEVEQLSSMIRSTPSSQRENKKSLRSAEAKALQWFKLDNEEYQKAKQSRDDFVRQSLENYLRALQACDDFNPSVVRFFALWLEHSDSPSADTAVQHALQQVPSWKFVGLTNQLTSRILEDGTPFQKTLSRLVTRICVDHPYHMVHNIYAGAMSAVSATDENGNLRRNAAIKIRDYLRAHNVVGNLITRIWQSCHGYVKLATTKISAPARNQKLTLQTVKIAGEVDRLVRRLNVPPATLHLDLRPGADYQNVPLVSRFRQEIKIAGGLSAPKILIAVGTDGKEYRQLFKGGNDDLRQDAIMEQVFGEVSKMLQNHKATRQRSIHIRTYKVVPLTANAGIIEFVPNSMPLADFLNPAHVKYNPGDMKADQVRSKIGEAARLPKESRYKVFKDLTARYQPVLRHFFFERFNDPDEWFARRLAYTRSTAAISMLGYVLGLGDRHTQNILLDEKSGEVIHIDLGVAFEAGRVLPIPEVVPFRMTRDIVDGMGITKTEGVFRRCCEFTMEALREETDGIMTLLNVLRYDPLYSWTLSPLRAKRIQNALEETEDGYEVSNSKKGEDEAGEADRALSVVEKKLSKTLSVAATVNELIQQATDERNLAVLFQGWAAYA